MVSCFWITILAWLLLPAVAPAQQHQRVFFETRAVEPASPIMCLLQDDDGFLWLGTQQGLSRFDGYKFISFRSTPGAENTLSDNLVVALLQDQAGIIWIGTNNGGLNKYNPATGVIQPVHLNRINPSIPDPVTILALAEDQNGTLWMATEAGLISMDNTRSLVHKYDIPFVFENVPVEQSVRALLFDNNNRLWIGATAGLFYLDPGARAILPFFTDKDNPDSHLSYDTGDLHQTGQGAIWIGTQGNGLFVLSPEYNLQVHYRHHNNDAKSLSDDTITSIFEDRAGNLWIGTANRGLNQFDKNTAQFHQYIHNPDDNTSLPYDRVYDILQDKSGILWVATWAGLAKHIPAPAKFKHITHQTNNPSSLSHERVKTAYEDKDKLIWIGTLMTGLNKWNPATGLVSHYPYNVNGSNGLRHRGAWAITEDLDGGLWIATFGGGLSRLDRLSNTFKHYIHNPAVPSSISSDNLTSLLRDQHGNFWIGTMDEGLNQFNASEGTFTHFKHNPADSTSLSNNYVWPLLEDYEGVIWAGTMRGGLNKFDAASNAFLSYKNNPDDPTSLSDDRVISLAEDPSRTLWVGTMNGGLNRFNRTSGSFTSYGILDGLPHETIASILADDHGRLWMGTGNGLSRFDPETQSFTNFDESDGLPSNSFHFDGAYKSPSGHMYFGTFEGLTYFHPDSVSGNPYIPPVYITEVLLFNEPADLDSSTTHLKHLQLPFDKNFLAFEFAALDFSHPESNQYAYKLEGLEEDWIDASDRRFASYPGLAPGHYAFKVKGSNNDHVWNKTGASLKVTILPPWWQTSWAYTLYALIGLSTLGVAIQTWRQRIIRKERERTMHRELEQAREIEAAYARLKTTQQQLIHAEKMASLGQLTAGIAHEIKNPLNFVNNFAHLSIKLTKEISEALTLNKHKPVSALQDVPELLGMLETNATKISEHGKRADRIVTGMMQHASGAKGERRKTNVNTLVKEYVTLASHSLHSTAASITIEESYDEEACEINMIPQEIGQVLVNILNNAIDAVSADITSGLMRGDPKIRVSTARSNQYIEICISDNGPGIPEEIKSRIFEPFFTTRPAGAGTGLGLSISYDIVTNGHGGQLLVTNTKDRGASFVIKLPDGESADA